jgi:hypothetical protein
MDEEQEAGLGEVIRTDEGRIRTHPWRDGARDGRGRAERDARAGGGSTARRRPPWRREGIRDRRAGSSDRGLHTKVGEGKPNVPKLRRQTFEAAVIERDRRRESSVEGKRDPAPSCHF